jgi:succinate dehydrogenase / fumarate reductase flavoprotein subunit
MHGSNRLGGNSLGDLLVFGKRSGEAAARYAAGTANSPRIDDGEVAKWVGEAVAPFGRERGENPYTLHAELQDSMQVNVGIIRTEAEMLKALDKISELKERARKMSVSGTIAYNPGWNLATDMPSLLTAAECVTRAALTRQESRGGHTRDDFPATDKEHWAKVNVRVRQDGGDDPMHGAELRIDEIPLPEMPDELKQLFEEA